MSTFTIMHRVASAPAHKQTQFLIDIAMAEQSAVKAIASHDGGDHAAAASAARSAVDSLASSLFAYRAGLVFGGGHVGTAGLSSAADAMRLLQAAVPPLRSGSDDGRRAVAQSLGALQKSADIALSDGSHRIAARRPIDLRAIDHGDLAPEFRPREPLSLIEPVPGFVPPGRGGIVGPYLRF